VDGVELTLNPGEIVGLVGETGSGKSVTAHAIMRLLHPAARVLRGSVVYEGDRELLRLPEERLAREIRGKEIAMIFQNPVGALNPVKTVGSQLSDVYRAHARMGKGDAAAAAIDALRRVGIPHPGRYTGVYGHQL